MGTTKTLAQLADDRREVEQRITARLGELGGTDAQRAEHCRALHMLHEELASVLEAIETASWGCLPMAEVGMGGALRWAVTGALRMGEGYRDAGVAWQKLADGEAAR